MVTERRPGYPVDDIFSIVLDDGGEVNLDMYSESQFVQEERWVNAQRTDAAMLEFTPIIPGTVVGKVLSLGEIVATFEVLEDGLFRIIRVKDFVIHRCRLNCFTGELQFHCDLEEYDLEYSYEWHRGAEVSGGRRFFPVIAWKKEGF